MTTCFENKVTEGQQPTDAAICFDCCLSRENARIAPNLCLQAGTVVVWNPATVSAENPDGLWAPPPDAPPPPATATPYSLPAGAEVGIIFCPSVSTLDGSTADCTVLNYHAKLKVNGLIWPVGFTAADQAVVKAKFAEQHVKMIVAV